LLRWRRSLRRQPISTPRPMATTLCRTCPV
jgi:hypothetical protein